MNKFCRNFLFLILAICFSTNLLQSQTQAFGYDKKWDSYRIQEHAYVLSTENQVEDLQSVLKFSDGDWTPMTDVNTDDLKTETWCKLSVFNPNDSALSLSFRYRFMVDTLALYIKTPEGLKLRGITGYRFPRKEREINSWMSYFLLDLLPQDTLHLYARVVVENPRLREGILYPRLAQSHFVRQDDMEEAAFEFAILGITLVFVVIGLISFFTFKERDFLYYSMLIFGLAMNAFALTFVHQLFVEPSSIWDNILRSTPFLTVAVISLYLFIANRLDLKERSSTLNTAYKWTSIIAAFLMLSLNVKADFQLMTSLIAGSGMAIIIFTMFVIIHAKKAKHPEANGLLFSSSILLCALFFNLCIMVFAPNQNSSGLIGTFGFILFAASLLYSLFKRISTIRMDKAISQIEKEKSDELLFNILPEEIALELKNMGKSEARYLENVSILFTDFKGFTQLSEEISADALISELQYYFEAFDTIIDDMGIEKIKTIGDSYMAATGLRANETDAATTMLLGALRMMDVVMTRNEKSEKSGLKTFQMRAGIHTGAVVAGVVGIRKFQYDIWGDVVNTASRMESSGQVDRVNISKDTYSLVKDDERFVFEHRGKINAKGKGEIDMYFVNLR